MEFYHGTPFGGKKADKRLALTGRNALVPFNRLDDLQLVLEVCKGFRLDCGAYAIWRAGLSTYPHWDKYLALVEKLHTHPKYRGAFIPDIIAGTEAENDALVRQFPAHLGGIPVFHMHHSLRRLRRLVLTYDEVALGGSPEYKQLKSAAWWNRMAAMMEAACDEHGRPFSRLHGLRLMDRQVIAHLPLTAGDSANAARNSADKVGDLSRGQRACLIADRVEQHSAAVSWGRTKGLHIDLFA